MGETLLSGLLRAGRRPSDLLVAEKRAERAAELREQYAVEVVDNQVAASRARTLILAVKPQDLAGLLEEISPYLSAGQLVVSLAAGITSAFIEARVPQGVAVARVMPNTPSLVDAGMAGLAAGAACTEDDLVLAQSLVSATGRVVRIPEAQMDALTAVSGSGPAYIFLVAESMIAAALELGLPTEMARELVVQTLVGSAKMLLDTGTDPALLRQQVTSKGGTTAAAIAVLESRGLSEAFAAAMAAARDRSVELAAEAAPPKA